MAATKKQLKATGKQATATLRYIRIAPRKMRLMAHVIKNLPVNQAEAQLEIFTRKPSSPLAKLLKSAIANAKDQQLDLKKLFVSDIRVDKGPMLKRFMPRAQGRATPIHKFTSHVYLTLSETDKDMAHTYVVERKKAKASKHEHHHDHAHEHAEPKEVKEKKAKMDVAKEKKQEQKAEVKKESLTQEKGFTKKTFRRKSV